MNQIIPNVNESIDNFILRIGELKNLGVDLTWEDISNIVNDNYKTNISADACRNRYRRYVRKNKFNDVDEIIEQKKYNDEMSQINAMYRTLAREDTIKEIALEAVKIMSKDKILSTKYISTEKSDCEGLLLISDWHYGIDIDNIYNKYNPNIAIDRINKLKNSVINKCVENNIYKLSVLNLGDMIAGNIHLPLRINSRVDVISLIMKISEIIAEFLNDLSSYVKINYYSVLDNHSRIDPNKKDSILLESLARITDWYLIERLKSNNNITIFDNVYGEDIADFNILGHNIIGVHGDKDKPNKIVERLSLYTNRHFDLMCSAHLHHFSMNENNLTNVVCNGSLMGTDQFASDLRLNSKPSQTFIVLTKNNPVEKIYKIIL